MLKFGSLNAAYPVEERENRLSTSRLADDFRRFRNLTPRVTSRTLAPAFV